jgi:hypothetical protein
MTVDNRTTDTIDEDTADACSPAVSNTEAVKPKEALIK